MYSVFRTDTNLVLYASQLYKQELVTIHQARRHNTSISTLLDLNFINISPQFLLVTICQVDAVIPEYLVPTGYLSRLTYYDAMCRLVVPSILYMRQTAFPLSYTAFELTSALLTHIPRSDHFYP